MDYLYANEIICSKVKRYTSFEEMKKRDNVFTNADNDIERKTSFDGLFSKLIISKLWHCGYQFMYQLSIILCTYRKNFYHGHSLNISDFILS